MGLITSNEDVLVESAENVPSEVIIGLMNGHAVGWLLKEAVRRVTVIIRNERSSFDVHTKQSCNGTMDDVCTSADRKAQEVYLRAFQECFPLCGVVAEEDALKIAPTGNCKAYFTIDPLDGTRAYMREASDGIATMVALVYHGTIAAAYIGDINTEEVYGYRPGSDSVYRITRLDTFRELRRSGRTKSLDDAYAYLRAPLDAYSPASRELVRNHFGCYEIKGSSIGIWAARLWKNEVAALLMPPGWETPWDSTPVVGISKKLGFVFMRPARDGNGWEQYEPVISTETYRRGHDTLVIHKSDLPQLRRWYR